MEVWVCRAVEKLFLLCSPCLNGWEKGRLCWLKAAVSTGGSAFVCCLSDSQHSPSPEALCQGMLGKFFRSLSSLLLGSFSGASHLGALLFGLP